MSVCKDVMIGKILIQTNEQTENPEVREYAERGRGGVRKKGGEIQTHLHYHN